MKNNPAYILTVLLIPALYGSVFSSCTKEGFSKCTSRVSIVFTDPYAGKGSGYGLSNSVLSEAAIFIYDRNKRLVATAGLKECRLDSEYRLEIGLQSGKYDFIVWAGSDISNYSFDNTDNLDLASVTLDTGAEKLISYRISSLCYGRVSELDVNRESEISVDIPIRQYSNEINFTVRGSEAAEAGYILTIEDDNGRYGFDSSFLPCDRFRYESAHVAAFSEEASASGVTVLRLAEGRRPLLSLTDVGSGAVLYPSYEGQETNLISLIKKAYGENTIDFDATHVFDIAIVFDAEMKATVYVDEWKVQDDDYEL